MSIFEKDDSMNRSVNLCLSMCEQLYKIKSHNLTVLFSDDIMHDRLQYQNEKVELSEEPEGLYVPGENGAIFINYPNYIKNPPATLITIVHELIHYFDSMLFVNDFCDGNWDNFENHEIYKTFRLWSEFHAVYRSLLLGREIYAYAMPEYYSKEDIIEEFQDFTKISNYKNYIESFDVVDYYHLFRYCAEVMLCIGMNNQITLDYCITNKLVKDFPAFKELFYDLLKMTTYKEAKEHLDLMHWKLFKHFEY